MLSHVGSQLSVLDRCAFRLTCKQWHASHPPHGNSECLYFTSAAAWEASAREAKRKYPEAKTVVLDTDFAQAAQLLSNPLCNVVSIGRNLGQDYLWGTKREEILSLVHSLYQQHISGDIKLELPLFLSSYDTRSTAERAVFDGLAPVIIRLNIHPDSLGYMANTPSLTTLKTMHLTLPADAVQLQHWREAISQLPSLNDLQLSSVPTEASLRVNEFLQVVQNLPQL